MDCEHASATVSNSWEFIIFNHLWRPEKEWSKCQWLLLASLRLREERGNEEEGEEEEKQDKEKKIIWRGGRRESIFFFW